MKGGSQTSTQETKMPQHVTDAQKHLLGQGSNMLNPFLNMPAYQVAGMNPDQMQAFDLARQMAQGAFTGGPGRGIPASAALGTMTNANAAQVTGAGIKDMMNPYLENVLGTTLKNMRGQYDDTNAAIGARSAAAGAYGGSREAVQRAALDKSHGEQVASTAAQLMSEGYDKASALALANAQMQQQTNLANAGAANDMSRFNASTENSFALQAPQIEDALKSSQQQRQSQALQQLLGIGNQQQQFAQGALDVPWKALERLLAITPQQYGSTTTSTQPKQGGGLLGTLLGTGLSILGMPVAGGGSIAGNLFSSDREDKTDIKKLGKDPQSGETLYAYRYKDDPKSYPKVVGPMAQDIEKKQPHRVRKVGGKRIVSA